MFLGRLFNCTIKELSCIEKIKSLATKIENVCQMGHAYLRIKKFYFIVSSNV